MGRKDASNAPSLPVDQYRKQIGRHDSRKDRKELKELKRRREAQKSAPTIIKNAVLGIVALCAFLFLIYFVLYFYLIPDSKDHSTEPRAEENDNINI